MAFTAKCRVRSSSDSRGWLLLVSCELCALPTAASAHQNLGTSGCRDGDGGAALCSVWEPLRSPAVFFTTTFIKFYIDVSLVWNICGFQPSGYLAWPHFVPSSDKPQPDCLKYKLSSWVLAIFMK